MELAHTGWGVRTHAGAAPHGVGERWDRALQAGGQVQSQNFEESENSKFKLYFPYHFEVLFIKAAKRNMFYPTDCLLSF